MQKDLAEMIHLRKLVASGAVDTPADLEQLRRRLVQIRERVAGWPGNERLLVYLDLSILTAEELISQVATAEFRH
jgi:hypothetical protein